LETSEIPKERGTRERGGVYIGGVVEVDGKILKENEKSEDDLISKDKRIKKEIARLKKLFKNIPKDTMNSVIALINNAAFMTVTLEDLQETINSQGPVSEYQNGENQWGTKKSPEVEIYNTMVKNLASVIKQLTDLIPAGAPPPSKELDPFEKIIRRGRNG
jgi:hypothetical protein